MGKHPVTCGKQEPFRVSRWFGQRGALALAALLVSFCPMKNVSGKVARTQPKGPVKMPLSPCSQAADQNGDGKPEAITHYVYNALGTLTDTVVFDRIGGKAHAWQHLTVDGNGKPTRSALRQPPAAAPLRPPVDCTANWCSRAWVGLCNPPYQCKRDAMDRVTVMHSNRLTLWNDYSCWSKRKGAWRYTGPSAATLLGVPKSQLPIR